MEVHGVLWLVLVIGAVPTVVHGTLVGSIGFSDVFGLATDNNIDLYGVAGTQVLSVNTGTGAGSTIFNYGGQGLGTAWGSAFQTESMPPVPVPAALPLFLSGLASLGWVAKKRKKAAV